jgi:hypothetical protein
MDANSVTWYVDDQQVYQVAGHTPHLDIHVVASIGIQPWIPTSDSVLLATHEIDYIRVHQSDSNEFLYQWGNDGSGKINSFTMMPFRATETDHHLSGKFEGKNIAQLLAISPTRHAQMMEFDGSSWNTKWDSGATGKIDWWYLNTDDQYVVGAFAGLGRNQLLAINDGDGYAHLMSYNSPSMSWGTTWTNL